LASLILQVWEFPNINTPTSYPGIQKEKSSKDLSGTYEYIYPYNSEDLIENQYIILVKSREGHSGWIYSAAFVYLSDVLKCVPGNVSYARDVR